MKRVGIILCAVMILLMCSCSSSGEVSATDKGISIAKEAVGVADLYLDGIYDYSMAIDQLNALDSETSYVENLPNDTSEERKQRTVDLLISTNISLLSSKILNHSVSNDDNKYDEIVEVRNELASAVGLSER